MLSVLNEIQTFSLSLEFEKVHSHHGIFGKCRYYWCEETAENFCE